MSSHSANRKLSRGPRCPPAGAEPPTLLIGEPASRQERSQPGQFPGRTPQSAASTAPATLRDKHPHDPPETLNACSDFAARMENFTRGGAGLQGDSFSQRGRRCVSEPVCKCQRKRLCRGWTRGQTPHPQRGQARRIEPRGQIRKRWRWECQAGWSESRARRTIPRQLRSAPANCARLTAASSLSFRLCGLGGLYVSLGLCGELSRRLCSPRVGSPVDRAVRAGGSH